MNKQLINPNNSSLLPINNDVKYRIKELDEIKTNLSNVKSKLDDEYKKPLFGRYWKEFDPFKKEKKVVPVLGNTGNVTNAWLKCYELLIDFDILPLDNDSLIRDIMSDKLDKNPSDRFLHFDNAAFPGSFILATHHLVNTRCTEWSEQYDWIASSLYDVNETNLKPLEDKYKLFTNYPNKWLMSDVNNGDVLLRATQEDFHKRYGGKVDLYTSDLGFDVSSDYNNQELIQLPANIGQIISGILTLKPTGAFITKQYMNFEPITVSIIYAMSQLFDEFYVCKPYTSRETNSETYLVGLGFKESVSLDHPYVKAMFDRIIKNKSGDTLVDIETPLFKLSDYPKGFIDDIVSISDVIFGNQMKKMDYVIDKISECMAAGYYKYPIYNPVVVKYNNLIDSDIIEWYRKCKILPIDNNNKLNMYSAF